MTDTTLPAAPTAKARPRGPRPRRISASRIGIYGFLIIAAIYFLAPLWVMIVTSLKTMPEIREGYLFNWPRNISFEAWTKAWNTACTGRDCEGVKPGFLNSVKFGDC